MDFIATLTTVTRVASAGAGLQAVASVMRARYQRTPEQIRASAETRRWQPAAPRLTTTPALRVVSDGERRTA